MSDEVLSAERIAYQATTHECGWAEHHINALVESKVAEALAQAQASLAAWNRACRTGGDTIGWLRSGSTRHGPRASSEQSPRDWGYSASYQDVLNLREKWEAATASLAAARAQLLRNQTARNGRRKRLIRGSGGITK